MYRLSIEEVAFAMGLLGDYEVAAGYLTATLGLLGKENLSGRMSAASHALMARGLLDVEEQPETGKLDETLAHWVRTMMDAPRSIRCESTRQGVDGVMGCFAHGGTAVKHAVVQNVVAELEALASLDEVLQAIFEFVGVEKNGQAHPPLGTTDVSLLQSLRDFASPQRTDRMEALARSFLAPSDARRLVKDLTSEQVTWGSILFLETVSGDQETPLVSNDGILYAQNGGSLWFFVIKAETGNQATAYHGGRATLKACLQPMVEAWFPDIPSSLHASI